MNILSLPRRTDPQSVDSVFVVSSASNQQTYGLTWDSLVQSMSDAIGGDFIAGNDMQIQYNALGEFAADPNFVWDYSSQILNVTGVANVSGTLNVTGEAHVSGAVTGQSFNGASISNSQSESVFLNGTGGYTVPKPLAGIAGDKQVIVNILGNYQSNIDFTWDNDTKVLNVNGAITATTFNGVALTTGGAATNYLDETGNYSAVAVVAAGSDTQLQFNSANSLGASPNLTWNGSSLNATQFNGVALSNAGAATEYLNGAGSYSPPPDTVVTPAGADTQLQFNDAGAFGANANLTFNAISGQLNAGSFNGVQLSNAGAATSYLDETGNYSTPGGVSPGGADTQVQFNDGGNFGVDANFTWDGVVLNSGLDHFEKKRIITPSTLTANVDDYNPSGIYDFGPLVNIDTSTLDGVYVIDTTDNLSGGSGTGMVVQVTVAGTEVVSVDEILDVGIGYLDGDVMLITCAGIPLLGSGTATFALSVSDFGEVNLLRMSADTGNQRITGFQAPPAGVNRIINVVNVDTQNSGDRLDLRDNDSNSLPENRMLLAGGNENLETDVSASLWYDHLSQRWRSLGNWRN
jgi:hypothetical protein